MLRAWWKEAVVYQIYPQSFYDSNGDGIGDLQGIIDKLDYVESLGIDVIWLTPIYDSPMDDNGYDIRDYFRINPVYGTMDDWKTLLHEVHARGMKLIMDLVVNHTSDEHEWFVASRSSKENDKRTWYIWRDGVEGGPPNNWMSYFTGSAWTLDEATDQYYLHLFSRKQPDLNWKNEEVRHAVYSMMRHWLDLGIDGFRMDVINMLSKAEGLPDAEGGSGLQFGGEHFLNGPQVHDFIREMHQEVLSHYDVMTVGECPGTTVDDALLYTDPNRRELNMLFQFEHVEVDFEVGDRFKKAPWSLVEWKEIIEKWQVGLQGRGWNTTYLTNHDQPRALSRFGNDGPWRKASGKLLATLLLSLQGTPFIYQGEEIGMTNANFSSIDQFRDLDTLNVYREAVAAGLDLDEIMDQIRHRSRDNARTPMQWSAQRYGGFSEHEPWIGVNENHVEINAQADRSSEDGIFDYYRRLIRLRKSTPALVYGRFRLMLRDDPHLFVYERSLEEDAGGADNLIVVLNFSDGVRCMPPISISGGPEHEVLISNSQRSGIIDLAKAIDLAPYEAMILRVQNHRL